MSDAPPVGSGQQSPAPEGCPPDAVADHKPIVFAAPLPDDPELVFYRENYIQGVQAPGSFAHVDDIAERMRR